MTRDQIIDMFTMRLDGHTPKEVGDKYGITKERVQQILAESSRMIQARLTGMTYEEDFARDNSDIVGEG